MASKQSPAAAGANRVIIGVVMFYVAILATMVAVNRYAFIAKSLIVPILLLAALLSGRFTRFVNDWAIFLGAVVFFDFCRGLIFAVTSHFELPMYLDYVIGWERWLCGGAIAPVVLQHLRAGLSDPAWVDRFFVLAYSSHFVFFLLFGFVIWHARPAAFRTCAVAIVAVMYVGLVFYFVVPTVPPWVAANEFSVLPPVQQIVRSMYNVHLPLLLAVFDVNPIAAMPSLHAALPAVCAFLALRYLGRWGLLAAVYAAVVCVAVIYLGEHYLIDVVAGVALALAVYAAVCRWGASADPVAPQRKRQLEERWAVRPIVMALLLIAAAFGFGQLSARWMGPLPITRAFIEKELMGRSIVAHYYLGRVAFAGGDFALAQVELARSLNDLSGPEQQKVIRPLLGISASRTRDFPAVIAALEPLHPIDDVSSVALLGSAYVESSQYEKGLAVLREARSRFPAEPEPLYLLTRYQYLNGEVDRAYVERAIETLRQFPPAKAEPFRRSLSAVLQDGSAAAGR